MEVTAQVRAVLVNAYKHSTTHEHLQAQVDTYIS